MARQIWKFNLETKTTLDLPENAWVLSVGAQGNSICLWVAVDTDAPTKVSRTFRFYGTGWSIEESTENLFYIGTVQMPYTGFVFHVFEEEDFGGVVDND